MQKVLSLLLLSIALLMTACSNTSPLPHAEKVNIEAFMGPWFVQGYTPILVDKEAYNAVEHYYSEDNQTILTTYQFRDGSFGGNLKTYTPKGFVSDDPSGALWKMQFIWPFKAAYVIIHLDESKGHTIIGHPNRKYAWIMTRSPEISNEDYSDLLLILQGMDYNLSELKRLPQNWDSDQERLQKIMDLGKSGPLEPR